MGSKMASARRFGCSVAQAAGISERVPDGALPWVLTGLLIFRPQGYLKDRGLSSGGKPLGVLPMVIYYLASVLAPLMSTRGRVSVTVTMRDGTKSHRSGNFAV